MKIKTIASGSSGNCYIIDNCLMLECGITLREISKYIDLFLIDGCLISHAHKDHNYSKKELELFSIPSFSHENIKPLQKFYISNYTVISFDNHHDTPCFGFLIKPKNSDDKLLFATDTSSIDYFFKDLTHIMIECNYIESLLDLNYKKGLINNFVYERVQKTHMSLKTCLNFLKKNDLSKLKELHIIHRSKNNSDAKTIEHELRKIVNINVKIIIY